MYAYRENETKNVTVELRINREKLITLFYANSKSKMSATNLMDLVEMD